MAAPDLVEIGSQMGLRQLVRIGRALPDEMLRALAAALIEELDERDPECRLEGDQPGPSAA